MVTVGDPKDIHTRFQSGFFRRGVKVRERKGGKKRNGEKRRDKNLEIDLCLKYFCTRAGSCIRKARPQTLAHRPCTRQSMIRKSYHELKALTFCRWGVSVHVGLYCGWRLMQKPDKKRYLPSSVSALELKHISVWVCLSQAGRTGIS